VADRKPSFGPPKVVAGEEEVALAGVSDRESAMGSD
jgi:hypothetical protein